MNPIRILVVDDHQLFIEGLTALLNATSETAVVGEAATGQEAITQATAVAPDVILMDIHMPDMNGVEATRRILKTNPHVGIIMLTMLEDDASVFAAMRAGARGYLLKGSNHSEMLQTIRAVAQGQALFGPAIARRIMHFFQIGSQLTGPSAPAEPFPDLTERERELLALIAQGKNNSEIADILVISPKTVRNHITSIFSKLQVADRAEAIVKARDAGLENWERG
ncbi:MAG: response regulator transcription factor [Anaerolineae bacterium]|nr:response regulator transcription factor [Anaerolineae bacterium]